MFYVSLLPPFLQVVQDGLRDAAEEPRREAAAARWLALLLPGAWSGRRHLLLRGAQLLRHRHLQEGRRPDGL